MKNPADKLDRLLRNWADHRSVTDAKLAELRARIGGEILDVEVHAAQADRPTRNASNGGRAGALVTMSVAALLLIALGLTLKFRWEQPDAPARAAAEEVMPTGTVLAASDIQSQSQMLAELQSIFDQQVVWVCDVSGEMKIGLADQPTPWQRSDKYVAVRLTLVSRRTAAEDWQTLRSFDVLSRQQELVELQPFSPGQHLAVWTYVPDDEMISIDLQCRLTDPIEMRVSTSELQAAGALSQIHAFEVDGVEYRLFQSAAILDEDEIG